MKVELEVNGFKMEASYTDKEVEQIFQPLLKKLTQKRQDKGSRLVVYLAAPPGTGKTTLSLFLEKIYQESQSPFTFQSISLDGYHHRREYLLNNHLTQNGRKVLLNDVKGCPETFDLTALTHNVQALQSQAVDWPVYDRRLHDVSEETLKVDADIVLVEGNWLLLDEDNWRQLQEYCDFSIFIHAEEKLLKNRLIERKMRGGLSREEAEAFYKSSDRMNVLRVLNHNLAADWTLELSEDKQLVHKTIPQNNTIKGKDDYIGKRTKSKP